MYSVKQKIERRKELEKLYGSDKNIEPGTVIRWFKCFGDPELNSVFTYIAIKVDSGWFYRDGYLRWSDLLMEIDKDNALEHDGLIEIATDWMEWTKFE